MLLLSQDISTLVFIFTACAQTYVADM